MHKLENRVGKTFPQELLPSFKTLANSFVANLSSYAAYDPTNLPQFFGEVSNTSFLAAAWSAMSPASTIPLQEFNIQRQGGRSSRGRSDLILIDTRKRLHIFMECKRLERSLADPSLLHMDVEHELDKAIGDLSWRSRSRDEHRAAVCFVAPTVPVRRASDFPSVARAVRRAYDALNSRSRRFVFGAGLSEDAFQEHYTFQWDNQRQNVLPAFFCVVKMI